MTTTHDQKPRGGRMPRNARRAQLLESALEVFVAQGYHAAAMDDIAERAGVSKPVLYQHFPGKLDLYLALLDQHCESLIQSVRHALASTHDNKQRVRATMDAYFAYVEDDGGARCGAKGALPDGPGAEGAGEAEEHSSNLPLLPAPPDRVRPRRPPDRVRRVSTAYLPMSSITRPRCRARYTRSRMRLASSSVSPATISPKPSMRSATSASSC